MIEKLTLCIVIALLILGGSRATETSTTTVATTTPQPSEAPTNMPTRAPTKRPTKAPTSAPTVQPSPMPTPSGIAIFTYNLPPLVLVETTFVWSLVSKAQSYELSLSVPDSNWQETLDLRFVYTPLGLAICGFISISDSENANTRVQTNVNAAADADTSARHGGVHLTMYRVGGSMEKVLSVDFARNGELTLLGSDMVTYSSRNETGLTELPSGCVFKIRDVYDLGYQVRVSLPWDMMQAVGIADPEAGMRHMPWLVDVSLRTVPPGHPNHVQVDGTGTFFFSYLRINVQPVVEPNYQTLVHDCPSHCVFEIQLYDVDTGQLAITITKDQSVLLPHDSQTRTYTLRALTSFAVSSVDFALRRSSDVNGTEWTGLEYPFSIPYQFTPGEGTFFITAQPYYGMISGENFFASIEFKVVVTEGTFVWPSTTTVAVSSDDGDWNATTSTEDAIVGGGTDDKIVVIAGVAAGICCLVLIIAALSFTFVRKRRRRVMLHTRKGHNQQQRSSYGSKNSSKSTRALHRGMSSRNHNGTALAPMGGGGGGGGGGSHSRHGSRRASQQYHAIPVSGADSRPPEVYSPAPSASSGTLMARGGLMQYAPAVSTVGSTYDALPAEASANHRFSIGAPSVGSSEYGHVSLGANIEMDRTFDVYSPAPSGAQPQQQMYLNAHIGR